MKIIALISILFFTLTFTASAQEKTVCISQTAADSLAKLADEAKASRPVIESLQRENELLRTQSTLQKELADLRAQIAENAVKETVELRAAITQKDAEIALLKVDLEKARAKRSKLSGGLGRVIVAVVAALTIRGLLK